MHVAFEFDHKDSKDMEILAAMINTIATKLAPAKKKASAKKKAQTTTEAPPAAAPATAAPAQAPATTPPPAQASATPPPAAPAVPAAPAPPASPAQAAQEQVTYETLVGLVQQKYADNLQPVIDALTKAGVSKISELSPEQIPVVYEELK